MTTEPTEVVFVALPITMTVACSVPVLPGTPDTEAPLHKRTELCASDASWLIGLCPACDRHAQEFCEAAGISWDGLVAEAWHPARRPREWGEPKRWTQAEARRHRQIFVPPEPERNCDD
jgi:hypothetical protein